MEASSKEPIYDHGLMKPYIFFDVSAGRETRQGSGSLRNQVTPFPFVPFLSSTFIVGLCHSSHHRPCVLSSGFARCTEHLYGHCVELVHCTPCT